VQNKGPQDLASEADLNTELLIRERLAKAFPQDAFLGEETQPTRIHGGAGHLGRRSHRRHAALHPRHDQLCVSIGFMQDGVIQFGMVTPRREMNSSPAANAHACDAQRQADPRRRQRNRCARASTYAGYSRRADRGTSSRLHAPSRGGRHVLSRRLRRRWALPTSRRAACVGFFEPLIKSWDALGAHRGV